MKILRSGGQSYTTFGSDEEPALARGLRRFGNSVLTPAQYKDRLEVEPGRLPRYLKEDYGLVIRQVISILDKVVRTHCCKMTPSMQDLGYEGNQRQRGVDPARQPNGFAVRWPPPRQSSLISI
jgi:hypothetical protein